MRFMNISKISGTPTIVGIVTPPILGEVHQSVADGNVNPNERNSNPAVYSKV
jgi:hypothetical protein